MRPISRPPGSRPGRVRCAPGASSPWARPVRWRPGPPWTRWRMPRALPSSLRGLARSSGGPARGRRPGRVARKVVREADGSLARARPEDAVAREHDRQDGAAGEVEDERDDPELAELEPRAAVAAEPGDRDEEVLGEE